MVNVKRNTKFKMGYLNKNELPEGFTETFDEKLIAKIVVYIEGRFSFKYNDVYEPKNI